MSPPKYLLTSYNNTGTKGSFNSIPASVITHKHEGCDGKARMDDESQILGPPVLCNIAS